MFDGIDPSQYDVEREMGGYPFAIVRVDYSHQDKTSISAPVTLGWARVRLFTHRYACRVRVIHNTLTLTHRYACRML